MKLSNVIFLIICVIAISSIVSIWLVPSGQDFMGSNTMWNGTKDIRDNLHAEPLNSLETLPKDIEKSMIISIPYKDYTQGDLDFFKVFVENGGTMLLMDDFGYGNTVLKALNVSARFNGKLLADPLFNYKNEKLPKITDLSPDVKNSGIEVLVLNHATVIENISETEIIARSSVSSYLDTNENGSLEEGEPQGAFPVAALLNSGSGRLIIISDPSIIVNTMLNRYDNANFIEFLVSYGGLERKVFFDESHLVYTTLDISKTITLELREILVQPYPLLGITALIFIVVYRFIFRTGALNGKETRSY